MRQSEYTYTGNMPSGNPFIWYFDKNKNTAFSTSRESAYWSKEPKIGDRVAIWKDDYGNITEVHINGQRVFKRTPETESNRREDDQRRTDAIIENWKKQ